MEPSSQTMSLLAAPPQGRPDTSQPNPRTISPSSHARPPEPEPNRVPAPFLSPDHPVPPEIDRAGVAPEPRRARPADRPLTLALVAHDACKAGLVDWVERHRAALAPFHLVATGTTGLRILERCPELRLRRLKSGPLGGDQQIGAMIADGTADALVFFVDPLSAMPHDVDVKALLRVALVYDIPCAMSRSTADLLMQSDLFARR